MTAFAPFVVMLCISIGWQNANAQEDPTQLSDLQIKVWDDYYHARVNMRYHSLEAGNYECWDYLSRLAGLLLSVITLAGPHLNNKKPKIWYAVGAIAFLVALAPLIVPFGDLKHAHAEFAGRWSELANSLKPLYKESAQGAENVVEAKRGEAQTEMAAIESDEVKKGMHERLSHAVMRDAERAENHFLKIRSEADSWYQWLYDFPLLPCGLFRLGWAIYLLPLALLWALWRKWKKLPLFSPATQQPVPATHS